MYSIWKLSDLAFHLQTSTISLFLFGENHKQHWKTVEGSVIALLNPSVLPPREVHNDHFILSAFMISDIIRNITDLVQAVDFTG